MNSYDWFDLWMLVVTGGTLVWVAMIVKRVNDNFKKTQDEITDIKRRLNRLEHRTDGTDGFRRR